MSSNKKRERKRHTLNIYLKLIQKLLSNKSPEELEALAEEKTQGGTPLLVASRYGHLEVVDYLLEHCKANVELGGGPPPLWAASAAGHLPVVKTLLKHGASVNNATLTNSTPLRAACFDGHLSIVRYLVEHKADMEIANRHGHTCLMISCYKGHKEIAKFLLDRGADVNRKSVKGNTALHDCAESGSLDIMKMLLKCNARMEKDGYGMTPLLAASVTGDHVGGSLPPVGRFPSQAVAALLLECGGHVDSRDSENNTPLHVAANNGCPEIIALLMKAGAHFDATNAQRKTAYELLEEQSSGTPALYPLSYVTLQCLAARAIEKHKLPYRGLISEEMEAFIELH
uniref:Fem-1 homolog A n=1 Tax=Gouania willdenowi TaxID=441366 RepID=A0A8C5H5K7_GOUWI